MNKKFFVVLYLLLSIVVMPTSSYPALPSCSFEVEMELMQGYKCCDSVDQADDKNETDTLQDESDNENILATEPCETKKLFHASSCKTEKNSKTHTKKEIYFQEDDTDEDPMFFDHCKTCLINLENTKADVHCSNKHFIDLNCFFKQRKQKQETIFLCKNNTSDKTINFTRECPVNNCTGTVTFVCPAILLPKPNKKTPFSSSKTTGLQLKKLLIENKKIIIPSAIFVCILVAKCIFKCDIDVGDLNKHLKKLTIT